MSRTTCCCFPVRFCVFLISTVWLLVTGAIAGWSWFILSQATDNIGSLNLDKIHVKDYIVVLTSTQRTVLYVVAGVYTFAFIISLFGLIGSLTRKRGLVRAFFLLVLVHVLVSIAAGAYFIYKLFSNDGKDVLSICQSLDSDSDRSACQNGFKTSRIVYTVVLAISWLFEFWVLHSVHEYSLQLRDETEYEAVSTAAQIPLHGASTTPYVDGQYDDPYYRHASYAFSTPNTAYKTA